MRRRLPMTIPGRAIIGLVALYALLLQAFLGFAAPASALPAAGIVPCAAHPEDGPDHGRIPIHVHACCTLVQAAALILPALVSAAPVLLPPPAVFIGWRPEAACLRTGPPPRAGTARGPPAA